MTLEHSFYSFFLSLDIPYDDVVTNFDKKIVSKRNCCANPVSETIQHVFAETDAVRYI